MLFTLANAEIKIKNMICQAVEKRINILKTFSFIRNYILVFCAVCHAGDVHQNISSDLYFLMESARHMHFCHIFINQSKFADTDTYTVLFFPQLV